MAQFLEKVTSYVSYVCFEVEPRVSLSVKESLLAYVEASSCIYPEFK